MDKMRKKRIKQLSGWCCIAVLVTGLAVMPLVAEKQAEEDGPVATIRSATATEGAISRDIRGGGTLTAEDAEEITVPTGVKLQEFLVKNGESVKVGDALATVDKVSVMTAITQIQQTLDYLDEQIDSVDDSSETTRIQAQTAGTVKEIYAGKGDSVQSVMLEHGALAVLSLDGCMAVDIETETALRVGDSVTVSLDSGETVAGRVESRLGNTFIVTVEDQGYAVDTEAEVTTVQGETLGSGKLYIHNPWKVTAAYGTVSSVNVSENESVTQGRTLMTLSQTQTDAQRQILVDRRQEYEQTMARLFQMYQSGTLDASCDGQVSGVDENSAFLLAAQSGDWDVMYLSAVENTEEENPPQEPSQEPSQEPTQPAEPEPSDPTEPEKVTYTGVVALVTDGEGDQLVFLTNGQSVTISDPSQLTPEQKDVTTMTTPYAFEGSHYLYVIEGEQLLLTATQASKGQLVLICEGKLISLGTVSGAGNTGSGGQMPGGNASATLPGGFGGMTGGANVTPSFEPYDLTEYTVLTVTPEGTMTLEMTVDELDIGTVYVGMDAAVRVTALGSESYPARVTGIGSGENSGGNSKFAVTLTLDRQGDMLPGMSASAVIAGQELENVLTIPAAALQENGAQTFVYTTCDGKTGTLGSPVEVTVGLSDGEKVQIQSGLEEGQTVYYAYYEA